MGYINYHLALVHELRSYFKIHLTSTYMDFGKLRKILKKYESIHYV